MLDTRQRRALDLLFRMPPQAVERKLGLRKGRIYAWLNYEPFRKALASRQRHEAEAAARIGTHVIVSSARKVANCLRRGDNEAALKAARGILQMSGILRGLAEPGQTDAGQQEEESLAAIIRSCREAAAPPSDPEPR